MATTRAKDMTGLTFGRWTVLSRGENYLYPNGQPGARWNCLCECGKEKLVHGSHLRNGTSVSCGCYNVEQSSTHGLSGMRAYNSYWHMMRRCSENAAEKDKELYYDKGIGVCERWLDVVLFIQDMGECPDGYELERLDGSLGYSSENCIWASELTQAQNRKTFKNNTSGKTGVVWDDDRKKWRALMQHNKIKYDAGSFTDFDEAVKAREELEIKFLGKIKER